MPQPALAVTVRREIAKPRRKTGARRPGDWLCRLTSASSVEPRQCLSRFQDRDRREEEGRQSSTVR